LKEPSSGLHRLLIYITVDQQAAQNDLSINALTPRDLILHEYNLSNLRIQKNFFDLPVTAL
jgi:hypothetical protein